jgi:chemotaxis protein MotA
LPGLGIVAAVLGVVITMGHIDAPPAEIGEHVGAALVGTFLGILMSYGFGAPLAATLEARVNEEAYYCLCLKAGLLAVYKGHPPAIAVEFARRVLPHDVRPSFNETEKFCRAAASGKTEEAAAA